jgi:hypothetical protein
MKKFIAPIILLIAAATFTQNANAQCKSFAKNDCKDNLEPYVHDGIFNAAMMAEGETAEIFKTFYSDQDYKIVVCAADNLPADLEFKIYDKQRNLIYSNEDDDYSRSFEFSLEESQQLILSVQIKGDYGKEKPEMGCLAIMIGFMNQF